MIPSNIPAHIRFYAALAAVVATVALLAAGLYFYLLSIVLEESAFIRDAKIQLATLEAKKGQVGDKDEELAAAREDIALLRSVLFDPEDPLPFLETLEVIGTTTNVTMNVTLGEPKNQKYPVQEFLVVATGAYPNVRKFLGLVELLPFETNIRTMRLQKERQGFGPEPSNVRLTLMLGVLTR